MNNLSHKPGARCDVLPDGQVCLRHLEAGSSPLVLTHRDLLHNLTVLPPHRVRVLEKKRFLFEDKNQPRWRLEMIQVENRTSSQDDHEPRGALAHYDVVKWEGYKCFSN